MPDKEPLRTYRSKRDVDASGEPSADEPRRLVSRAVPKGPSTDPREKRLATRTDGHDT